MTPPAGHLPSMLGRVLQNGHDREAVRVVRGAPTPEEVAALVGVLLTRRGETRTAPPARWRTSALPVWPGLRPAPGAWRASSLPR
ncbi:MAG TPA: acyl-CoA carboxylase subunit epsilon [Micromonosporaceae bacterium]|nr:acyl-CoA carboxylase subunit epsilon [Micromonosporaceae bacterium]